MKYYKDTNNKIYADPILANHEGLVEITKAEVDLILAPTPDEVRLNILTDITTVYKNSINALTVDIPIEEQMSWTEQKQEAKAWTLDNTAATPILDGILITRTKYTKSELVAKVIEKSTLYANAVGYYLGIKQKAEDELA